jgi:hypothetical protein
MLHTRARLIAVNIARTARCAAAECHRPVALTPVKVRPQHWSWRLPFYYESVTVGVAFVTMAIGVTARAAFALLPPLMDKFGGIEAFSFGFLVSAAPAGSWTGMALVS